MQLTNFLLMPEMIERTEKIREVIEALNEANKHLPIIVEGKRDVQALRDLGLSGSIITLHNGKSLYDFCMDISERFKEVILLLDWDEKGEELNRELTENLRGHCEEFSQLRELLKLLCQKEITEIEGIPKLLKRLEDEKVFR